MPFLGGNEWQYKRNVSLGQISLCSFIEWSQCDAKMWHGFHLSHGIRRELPRE